MKTDAILYSDPIVREYNRAIRRKLGARLKKAYLFGSHARGDAWQGSDYDYALVVDYRDSELEDKILDISALILDRHDALISTQIFTEQEWQLENKLPLGINILKEGIEF